MKKNFKLKGGHVSRAEWKARGGKIGFFKTPLHGMQQIMNGPRQERNALCRCGSMKKYKHCCMNGRPQEAVKAPEGQLEAQRALAAGDVEETVNEKI